MIGNTVRMDHTGHESRKAEDGAPNGHAQHDRRCQRGMTTWVNHGRETILGKTTSKITETLSQVSNTRVHAQLPAFTGPQNSFK